MSTFNSEDGISLAREIADALRVDPNHPGTRRLASALGADPACESETEALAIEVQPEACRSIVGPIPQAHSTHVG